jgi:hypothetical protein
MSVNYTQIAQTVGIVKNVYGAVGPMIHDVVVAVEVAMPTSGQGAAKLAAVQSVLKSVANVAGIVEQDFLTAWPVIASVISAIVSLYNLGNGWTTAIAGVTAIANAVQTPSA